MVNDQGVASIQELSDQFSVSEMTIHRDLNALESMGVLRKIRGGAESPRSHLVPMDFSQRMASFQKEKEAIGKRASEFIKADDTVFFGPGTTSIMVARHCHGVENFIAYTNGPQVVYELAKLNGVEVHCSGGLLSRRSMAYLGPEAEEAIKWLRPDKCFIGVHGLVEDGVLDPDIMTASMKRRIVEVSQEVYLVITPDKFGNMAPQVSFPLEAIDVVITHHRVPEEYLRAFDKRGIHCVIVGEA